MSKNKNKNTKASDYITNKLLAAFTLAFLLILVLMNIGRMMTKTTTLVQTMHMMPYFAGVCAAGVVFGIVYGIVRKNKGKDDSYCLLSGKNIAVFFGILTFVFGSLTYAFRKETLTMLYVVIPSLTVLYIVFYSYPRDFFVIACTLALGAVACWLTSDMIGGTMNLLGYMVGAGAALLLILGVVAVLWALRHGVFFKEKRVHAPLMFVCFGLALVALALAVFVGSVLFSYTVFGLIGVLVLLGVYYTIDQI